MEYVVVANYWKANSGWTHEEEVDRIYTRTSAETYVNSLGDEDLKAWFSTDVDAIQFDILDGEGNKLSDYWIDRDDVGF